MTDMRATADRRGHPLLRPFPLVVLTLATFLVVFTLLVSSLRNGPGALSPGGVTSSIVSARGQRLVVKTTPSGRVVATGAPAGPEGAQSAPAPLVTSSSGGGAIDD